MTDVENSLIVRVTADPRFQAVGALLAFFISMITLVELSGVIDIIPSGDDPPGLAEDNMMIVLDRSEAMAQSFDGGTKLDAARKVVPESLKEVSRAAAVGLRQFGGECGADATELLVPLAVGNKDEIESKLKDIEIEGQSNLVAGVVEASGDFDQVDKGDVTNPVKRIIVITAMGADTCSTDPTGTIKDSFREREDFAVRFTFIGIDLRTVDLEELEDIAAATGSGGDIIPDVFNAQSTSDLRCIFEEVATLQPVLIDTLTLLDILDDGRSNLNDVLGLVNSGDFEAAQVNLGEAGDQLELSQAPFDRLGALRGQDEFDQLYDLGFEVRETQAEMQVAADSIIAFAEQGDDDNEQAAGFEYNSLASKQEGIALDIQGIVADLVVRFECTETRAS